MAPIDLKSRPVVFRIHPGAQEFYIEYTTASQGDLLKFAALQTYKDAIDLVMRDYTKDENGAIAYPDVEKIVNNNQFQLEYLVFKTSMRYRRNFNREDKSLTVVLDERLTPLADDSLFAVQTTGMDKKEFWLCETHVYTRDKIDLGAIAEKPWHVTVGGVRYDATTLPRLG